MRVAVVTESFLPQVNGVTGSVLRVCEHLVRQGHEALVVAPGPGPDAWGGVPVLRVPALPLPFYSGHRLAAPWPDLAPALRAFAPDVVHLASPTLLGAQAAGVARRLGVPGVAVYQTDLPGYAARYGVPAASRAAWRWLRRVHAAAERTLAPSRHACAALRAHGVPRVARWPRGVDLERFSPVRRDEGLRARLAPGGEVLLGYVGRLAREKQLDLLAAVQDLPGTRLVVVGEGPQGAALRARLPRAAFLGRLDGDELGALVASLDVFVHTGAHETFCQAAQEALAAGVPVVAPAAGGLLDLVEPGATGGLFAPGSAAGLRRCTEVLARDPALRAAQGAAARRSVAGRDWASVGDELVAHYRDALGSAA
ncbi:glycosyltransferase family 4 protein [Vallicoccus soli]|uniref:Glycosyltransferase family 1 protein n=1 Tax=Vallicoccus soli TaxID=2339232 RepID=A0A3A3ZGC3_9ACTN|nr:glycosyltransferase family 1 protein [Vallicoccus soli]RJK94266.1 glycosyltransferase family 1 protein [Vallicoccus soli]